MKIVNALAGVAVGDLQRSVAFYSRLIGRTPDQRLMEEVAEYQFAGGGWLQIFKDDMRAGKASLTLVVHDLEATIKAMDAAGISHAAPARTELVDMMIVNDPDGNQVVFAQSKSASNRAAA